MCFRRLTALFVAVWLLGEFHHDLRQTVAADGAGGDERKPADKIVPIHKTDLQWKKLLTPKQFDVTRGKATEPAYSGKLWHNKRAGTYRCVCCGLELFSSETKFDSQTGWPSFWMPVDEEHVNLTPDISELPPRTEVLCARCAAHLGHVFGDGPQPTGLRYCINSVALNFEEAKVKSVAQPRQPLPARSPIRRVGQ